MVEDPKTWLALGTSVLAFAGGIYAATTSRRSQQEVARLNARLQLERDEALARREAQTTLSKFRDPLMHAAYDLQSRIFNILERGFLDRYYFRGSAREKEYAVENTVFLVAQFLGWTEAIREEINSSISTATNRRENCATFRTQSIARCKLTGSIRDSDSSPASRERSES